LISVGNIRNADLETLFVRQIPANAVAFAAHDYIELNRSVLVVHD
jgi:hypothetical protein